MQAGSGANVSLDMAKNRTASDSGPIEAPSCAKMLETTRDMISEVVKPGGGGVTRRGSHLSGYHLPWSRVSRECFSIRLAVAFAIGFIGLADAHDMGEASSLAHDHTHGVVIRPCAVLTGADGAPAAGDGAVILHDTELDARLR